MKYSNAFSFRSALETRLNAAATASQTISVSRLRKLVTLERFLARLLEAAPDRWVLKGSVALEFRAPDRARATKDLALWMRESEDAATEDMIHAALVDLRDYFGFSIERVGRIDADQEGAANRFRSRAEVAGRQFETVVVDVSFGGTLAQEPDLVPGSAYLAFAGLPPIHVPTLPLEFHVAEKLHAYTRRYGGVFESSRVKDLIDLVLIASFAEFNAGELRQGLQSTFTSRNSHLLPTALPSPPEGWTEAYAKLAAGVDIESDVIAGHTVAESFLNPVLADQVSDRASWDSGLGEWREPDDPHHNQS